MLVELIRTSFHTRDSTTDVTLTISSVDPRVTASTTIKVLSAKVDVEVKIDLQVKLQLAISYLIFELSKIFLHSFLTEV